MPPSKKLAGAEGAISPTRNLSVYFLVLAGTSPDWAEKVEADFFQKRADVTQEKLQHNFRDHPSPL